MSRLALFVGILSFLSAVSSLDQDIPAEPGQNVTLPCRVPSNIVILALNWSRTDLPSKYVFFYRDGHPDSDNQDPSFMNQVELNDSEMKDGDLSVILKNVTTDFTGKYMCQIRVANKTIILIKIVNLNVTDKFKYKLSLSKVLLNKGHRGRVGLIAAVSVFIIVVAVVGFVIYKKRRTRLNSNPGPADEEAVEEPIQHV